MREINWDELFRRNAAKLKGLCRRYTGSEAIAEDLVQETFVTAIDKFSTYRGFGSLDGWIRKIAINKALLYLRNKQVEIPLDAIEQSFLEETEMEISDKNKRSMIEQAAFTPDELLMVIDALPPHHRTVFNLYVVDGFSHQQISRMMSISTGTSKSHLARARKKAQEILYEKAVQKQPETREYRATLLLLMFRPNYIDSIFRKGLSNFELPSATSTIASLPNAISFAKWNFSLAGKALLLGGTIPALVLAGYMGVKLSATTKNKNSNLNNAQNTCLPVTADSIPVDTFKIIIPEDPHSKAKKEPSKVIIKKTIILHDTVRLEKPVTK